MVVVLLGLASLIVLTRAERPQGWNRLTEAIKTADGQSILSVASEIGQTGANDANSRMAVAAVLLAYGRADLAVTYLDNEAETIRFKSQEEEGFYWRFVGDAALTDSGLTVSALAAYERALQAMPNDHLVLNNYGYILADTDGDAELAFQLTNKACELRPGLATYLDSRGWALYKLGLYDRAIEDLQAAVHGDPTSWEIRYHLASAYSKIQYQTEARIELEKAARLAPRSVDSKDLMREIDVRR